MATSISNADGTAQVAQQVNLPDMPSDVLSEILNFSLFRDFLALKQVCNALSSSVSPPLRVSDFERAIQPGTTSIKDLHEAGRDMCRFAVYLGWERKYDMLGATYIPVGHHLEERRYRDLCDQEPVGVFDVLKGEMVARETQDSVGRFLMDSASHCIPPSRPDYIDPFSSRLKAFVATQLAGFFIAYCEGGRYDGSFLLAPQMLAIPYVEQSIQTDPADAVAQLRNRVRGICLGALFELLPAAALICLQNISKKNDVATIAAVNWHVGVGPDVQMDNDVPTPALEDLQRSCWVPSCHPLHPDRHGPGRLSEVQKKVLITVIGTYTLEQGLVNVVCQRTSRHLQVLSLRTTLLHRLLDNDMVEATLQFLNKYTGILSPTVLRSPGSFCYFLNVRRFPPKFTPMSLAVHYGFDSVVQKLKDMGVNF